MSDETLPEFGAPLPKLPAEQSTPANEPRAARCPACGTHFSPDGRFCPFDGAALVATASCHPAADALLGVVLDGRYELLRVVGEGGMGTVYEARHRALGKRFAVKVLRKDLARDAEVAARFIQEARTAAAVSHPGLVEITDFGRLDSGQVYFVMELLEGCSLAALLRRGGPLAPTRGLAIVRQLAHALKAAHDASIVHRDLKPDNIHVGPGDDGADHVKVVDFGLAKVLGSSKLTRAGVVFGTPHYMSPEQAAGEVVDHRADIYALGVVMYEMFTGKVPFEADSYMGVLSKHLYLTPASPSALSPELSSLGVEPIILRCLQKRPEARYDGLDALLKDLDERGSHLPPPGPPAPRGEPVPSRRARRLAPLVGALVACALVAGLVAAWRSHSSALSAAPSSSSFAAPPPTRALPEAVSSRPPGRTVAAPSAAPSQAPSVATPGPARKPAAGGRGGAPSSPRTTTKKTPSVKRGAGAADIVDPWAR